MSHHIPRGKKLAAAETYGERLTDEDKIARHHERMKDEQRLYLRDKAAERFAAALVFLPPPVRLQHEDYAVIAATAYDLADALMAERDARRAREGEK